jgi:hypothetical protein
VAVVLGARWIIAPGFRQSLIRSVEDMARTAEALGFAQNLTRKEGLALAYESPLDPEKMLLLLRMVDLSEPRIQFDTGNPAIYGHRAANLWSHFAAYAAENVHVKDDPGTSLQDVPLGEGRAELNDTFAAFARQRRPSSFTLEGNYEVHPGRRIRRDVSLLNGLILRRARFDERLRR